MVVKYDNGTLMPLWVANFQFQNPMVFQPIETLMVDNENSIFGLLCMGC